MLLLFTSAWLVADRLVLVLRTGKEAEAEGEKAQMPEPESPESTSALPLTSCATSGKVFTSLGLGFSLGEMGIMMTPASQ